MLRKLGLVLMSLGLGILLGTGVYFTYDKGVAWYASVEKRLEVSMLNDKILDENDRVLMRRLQDQEKVIIMMYEYIQLEDEPEVHKKNVGGGV
jgi:hypothetical protein